MKFWKWNSARTSALKPSWRSGDRRNSPRPLIYRWWGTKDPKLQVVRKPTIENQGSPVFTKQQPKKERLPSAQVDGSQAPDSTCCLEFWKAGSLQAPSIMTASSWVQSPNLSRKQPFGCSLVELATMCAFQTVGGIARLQFERLLTMPLEATNRYPDVLPTW